MPGEVLYLNSLVRAIFSKSWFWLVFIIIIITFIEISVFNANGGSALFMGHQVLMNKTLDQGLHCVI